ncbi:glycoside hydrolase [bacterium]|jgi:hypothetical protein|nr:glycoside hydrolase [bacterium]MDB4745881.1 glycoside hydrolase [Verrucomicrobiota bacterium]
MMKWDWSGFVLILAWGAGALVPFDGAAEDRDISLGSVGSASSVLQGQAGESRVFTWWMPDGASDLVLPISGGISIDWTDSNAVSFLRERSPWELNELPVFGARYGQQTLVVIVPWPHYAELVFGEKIGVRFSFPIDRNNTTPCELVVRWADNQPLSVAKVFREWRKSSKRSGPIPKPRTLIEKADSLNQVERLFGAAHFYLWGPSGFSRHDVDRRHWIPFAKALSRASGGSYGTSLRSSFSSDEQKVLSELAAAEFPLKYLTIGVASAIDRSLSNPTLAGPGAVGGRAIVDRNRSSLVSEFGSYLRPVRSWGDGLSVSLLDEMHGAGIERALLVMSDLYSESVHPEAVARARELGYPIGPYDSYHSVHSPDALPDDTWSTAQFDTAAFDGGRVIKEAGRRQGGFKGRGYHLAPQAAWPYVQRRVNAVQTNNDYSAWFIDCDATAECFDDYSPLHSATRIDDMLLRRQRLAWLENDQQLLVGSEGGSILFSDVIHFGHGVHTPYIGHLAPGFRDRESSHFLGRHWPPDSPEQSFKAVPVPPHLRSPYFDPQLRIPLYQAVLGDELVTTHHWSFDSLKLSDVESTRALLEILYRVPPMYHLNREMWPKRKEKILRHLAFWAPLHQIIAPAELVDFEWLTEDRLVQRTSYQIYHQRVSVTVNFGQQKRLGLLGKSAEVSGVASLMGRTYTVD